MNNRPISIPGLTNSRAIVGRFSLILILSVISITSSGNSGNPLEYEDSEIYMRLVIRNADQLSGFYVGREFPKNAIGEILKTCFITPIVKNKQFDVLWIEPDSWMFMLNDKPIERIKRDYWKKVWNVVGLSMAHQSTFGWTLMPEIRDLRFDEGVGGSLSIPMQTKPFTLKARFNTGLKKEGTPRVIIFKDISCAK
jgi:hypothetical protein